MKNVLITGATGFVGSNLARQMSANGCNVSIIVRNTSKRENIADIENLNVFEYNRNIEFLADFIEKSQIDVVYHLASLFVAEHNSLQVKDLIESNISFGTELLEAMKIAGIKNIVNTGTSWQHYEDKSYNPVCLYAAMKEAFSKILDYYVMAAGFNAITLKLFDSYGENDRRDKLINMLSDFSEFKKNISMSPGKQMLNLLHVEDIVKGFYVAGKMLMEKEYKNESFAVAAKENYSLKEVLDLFQQLSGQKLNVTWGARPYRRREVMRPWSKYKTLPGWTAKISLKEGLERIIDRHQSKENK
ncbi:MAG: NAD(P)-dependent oxidoreductase [Candidatus Omnitrophota bacterium]|nr:NAD(P)-dependent oxidoreductase [Candidatus Omnitrophota bacterium]